MTQQDFQQNLALYSNNSLDIRSESGLGSSTGMATAAAEHSAPASTGNTPNSFRKAQGQKQASPTAVTDLLAMLDDHVALHAQLQSTDSSDSNLPMDPRVMAQSQSHSQSNSVSNSSGLSPQRILKDSTHFAPEDDPLAILSRSLDNNGSLNFRALDPTNIPNLPISLPQHTQQQQQPCIDPNLLSNAGSHFVDSGFPIDRISPDNFQDDDTNSIFDDFTFQRRPSELTSTRTATHPELHTRNSISYNTDFWNLPSSTSNQRPNYKSHRSFGGVLPSSTTTVRPASTGKRSESLRPLSLSSSPFKIDNELTKLLDDYNLSYSIQKPVKKRTGSFNTINNPRRSSVSEPQNRVQKQRASMSLVDGNNQDLIAKLYGDVKAPRPRLTSLSWENAIISDDEDEDEDEEEDDIRGPGSAQIIDTSSNAGVVDDEEEGEKITREHSSQGASTDFLSHNLNPNLSVQDATFVQPNLLVNSQDHILDAAALSSRSAGSSNFNPLHMPLTASTSPSSYNSNYNTNSQSSSKPRKRQSFSKPPQNSKSSSPLEEDEKPFKCQECPKAFRRSEHLKRHIRSVHSSERPFHCCYCDKKFSRSDNLSQHLKTHKKHGDF
ncbi:LANO_0H13234g1_1 [Lachancea nothofagi CBS 11611]|uniref:LANO_0H13234g1_1 n=1 Tax=Lachancea nothofagi CBS 11611 TaxID=1266666 RepID=A0A1G4KMP6_9SACH|nr:LANO_0H13234g1_1 [Lachancea nothofagi CBS 11611]